MTNKLLIFWGDKNRAYLHWELSNGNMLESSTAIPLLESHEILKADLAALADLAQGKQVELVLCDSDVHVSQVKMPNKALRHLRKAVPYLLEEQLAEPVDKVFVALGERLADGQIPVRAINLDYFESLLAQFEKAEIKLDAVRVDLDLLRQPTQGYRLFLFENKVLLSEKNGERWGCALEDFSWLVQKQLAKLDEEELPVAIPMTVMCDNNDMYAAFEQQLPVGRFSPQMELIESVEQRLAQSKQKGLNLLQGPYERKTESSPLNQMLAKLATIAGVILAVHLLYQGSQWVALNQQIKQLGQQKVALWKQAFPGRKVPANQDAALRSFMRTLGGGEGESSFLALLNSTSQKIEDLQQIYPTNISYDRSRGELRIDLVAKDLSILNQYRDELKQSGHEVDMSSATQRGDGYSSRLIIRR